MQSLVIEDQECEVQSVDYQLYFSPYILSNPMAGITACQYNGTGRDTS